MEFYHYALIKIYSQDLGICIQIFFLNFASRFNPEHLTQTSFISTNNSQFMKYKISIILQKNNQKKRKT